MTEKEDDRELVEKYLAGDQNALNEIAKKYSESVYWHARRMTGGHLDADEVVQETLIAVMNKLKDFRFDSNLYTWIYKIASNKAISLLRKRAVKKFFSFDEVGEINDDASEDIVVQIDRRDKLKKLENILKKLPVKQREVFSLKAFEEMTYEEISEITGSSVGALKANYFHALKKIKELMDE